MSYELFEHDRVIKFFKKHKNDKDFHKNSYFFS